MNEQELKWNRLADILFPGQFNHVLCTHTTSILNVLLLRFLNLFFVVSLVVVILGIVDVVFVTFIHSKILPIKTEGGIGM